MNKSQMRRIWLESSEHGTLSWKAFKVAARAIEKFVLENQPEDDDDEVIQSRPMTEAEWNALTPEQQRQIKAAEELFCFGDPTLVPQQFTGFHRSVDFHADGNRSIRLTRARWSDAVEVGTYTIDKEPK